MDIDSDFSAEARAYAIKYVTEFYGTKKVAGIMTMAKMGPKDALTYAPKIYAKSIGLNQKEFNGIGAELRAMIGDAKHLAEIEEMVQTKYANNHDALMVWDAAKRLEGTIKSYGQHAAGIISIMEDDIEDFIPLMLMTDKKNGDKMVIQADMISAEAHLGFIKFDFLGLKNLNVITACQKMIEQRYGRYINTYEMEMSDPKVYEEIFAKGNTNFVFQFESDGMKGMLKQLNPTRFGDLVLAVSVYRPGPMQFINAICECKHTGEKSDIIDRFPVLEEVLAETYGFPVYQEQVMKIMTVCAGFDLGHADNVRRFMSKKKADKLAAEKPAFVEGCVKTLGANPDDAEWLFEQLMPFAEYGFNKSHAAAYSYVAYITAWFKLYYPEEYLCCAMLEQGEKTLQIQKDCRTLGIELLPVSVNDSQVNYSVESKGKIRMGLSAIKGLQNEAANIVESRSSRFKNFEDFISRCDIKSNSLEACILSGACDEFIKNRDIAFEYAKEYGSILNERDTADANIKMYQSVIDSLTDTKEIASKEKTKKSWVLRLDEANRTLSEMSMPVCFESTNREKCAYEIKYLGMYLGKSPLDDFNIEDSKYTDLSNREALMEGSKVVTLGIIMDYRQIVTKNGDDMAFFKILTKESEEFDCVCFPKSFAELETKLEDNMVVEISGKLGTNKDDELQIDIQKISVAENTDETLLIDVSSAENLRFVVSEVKKYFVRNGGIDCYLSNFCGNMRRTKYKVSRELIPVLENRGIAILVQ